MVCLSSQSPVENVPMKEILLLLCMYLFASQSPAEHTSHGGCSKPNYRLTSCERHDTNELIVPPIHGYSLRKLTFIFVITFVKYEPTSNCFIVLPWWLKRHALIWSSRWPSFGTIMCDGVHVINQALVWLTEMHLKSCNLEASNDELREIQIDKCNCRIC